MMSWSGGWPWTAQAMSGPLRATGEGQQGRAVAFATQLQDALLRCSQWPVELAAEGSPGQPLCLAPVWPGSCATGTSGSCTNASNQTLSRLMLTSAASATQSASKLPSSTKPNQQLLMGSEAVQGPCSASQSVDLTGKIDTWSSQEAPAVLLGSSLNAQHMNPVFASETVEHVGSMTSLQIRQPPKVSTYLVGILEAMARAGASLHSSKSMARLQAPSSHLQGAGEGLLGLMAHHAARQMATTAPWQSERGDRTQASDWQRLKSEVRTRRNQ
ncbi:hypothetical protein HaLaN_14231, partial [Haematococcus lacustris]